MVVTLHVASEDMEALQSLHLKEIPIESFQLESIQKQLEHLMPNRTFEFCSSNGALVSPYVGEVREGDAITISIIAKDNGTPGDVHTEEKHVITWYPRHLSALQDKADVLAMVRKVLQRLPISKIFVYGELSSTKEHLFQYS